MKHFLPLLLLTFSFFSFSDVSAQFVFTVNVQDCSGPAICDGSASIDSTNTLNFSSITWYMNGNIIQNGGTSISNLCPGNYSVNAMGGGMVLTSPFIIGTSTANPCASFGVTLTETPASSQNACDGSISANVYGGSAPYTYAWNIGGGMTTQNATNLCVGTYSLTVMDANGCSWTGASTIFYDTTTINPCAGFSPTITVTDCSAPGACDGAAVVSCPTCTFFGVTWSQGSTTFAINNLCEGLYEAYVFDTSGCSVTLTEFVGYNSGGNIDSINVIGSLATGGSITGTLMSSWIYNCDIDLSMLDTAYMVSATFGNNPSNQDSLYTVWYMADTTGAFTYVNCAFYAPFAVGTYNLVLQVYCPIKSTPIYYNVIAQFDVQNAGLGSNSPMSVSLSPNPVQDVLSIKGLEAGSYAIYNQAGQILQSGSFSQKIDVRSLANGSYFVQLNGQMLPFIKMHQ
ncbi:MAG: hypothetical protein RLZZ211_463 [Bacteroidota bacterium]|jgi:hypothetical protein